jgi:hypothetical protein
MPKAERPSTCGVAVPASSGRCNKKELLGLVEDYRQGLVPLIVPLT